MTEGLRYVGNYREFFNGGFRPSDYDSLPCLADSISKTPVAHKREIVAYLRGGEVDFATSAMAYDVFTGEPIGPDRGRTDDKYAWGEKLAYYVERHNLRLPDEFVSHILRKLGIPVMEKA